MPLTVTLVANEGFLVEGGGRKVLIDALFTGPTEGLQAPPPTVLDRLRGGRAPFDGIDLVLVTHHHPDHFDAALVLAFLEGNARAHLVTPPSAIGKTTRDAARYAKVQDRVVVADSARGSRRVNVNGIPVRPIPVGHSGDDRAGVENVMYVFSLGGRTFFHAGDATDDPQAYASVAGAGRDRHRLPPRLVSHGAGRQPDPARLGPTPHHLRDARPAATARGCGREDEDVAIRLPGPRLPEGPLDSWKER